MVAKNIGLDTKSNASLWKDFAMVELNYAVMYSFQVRHFGWTARSNPSGHALRVCVITQGLEGCSREPGFDRSTVRDSGKGKISRWDVGFDRHSGSGIRQNLGRGCRIGKENRIRGRHDRCSGCGIVVEKEWECGIMDPPYRVTWLMYLMMGVYFLFLGSWCYSG